MDIFVEQLQSKHGLIELLPKDKGPFQMRKLKVTILFTSIL